MFPFMGSMLQRRLYTCQQIAHGERLGEVARCASGQGNIFRVRSISRDHDDRHIRTRSQCTACLNPVHLGHLPVEHYQVRNDRRESIESFFSIGDIADFITVRDQPQVQGPAEPRVIVNNQYAMRGLLRISSSPRWIPGR